MKKTIISLSLAVGLVLCGGMISSNKFIEVKNNIKINLLSKSYVMDSRAEVAGPGILPPKSQGPGILPPKAIA